MTTTPEETHMPTDPNRALLRAVDRLTTQVRRIADTLTTPVTTDDDGAQTTGDDATRERIADALTIEHYRRAAEGIVASPEEHCAAFADAVVAVLQERKQATSNDTATRRENVQLRAELDRIYTRRTPGGEGYVSLTIDEQIAMGAELARIRRALDPDDETYIRETVDEHLAMSAKVAELETAIERVRAIKPSPARSEFNARATAQDEGWDQALVTVRAALIGPIADDS